MAVTVSEDRAAQKSSRDLVLSVVLHVLVLGGLLGAGFVFHRTGEQWGDRSATAGAVQATMVNSIPLPPKVQPKEDSVLASENPSPAPPPPTPRTEPPPKPTDIPVESRTPPKQPQPKIAERSAPEPPKHPQPTRTDPNLASSGETAGMRVAMTSVENRVGTSSTNVTDSAFGDRFAFYVRAMTQKISQQWYTQTLDPAAHGRKVSVTFRVDRDGSPSDVRISTPSGDTTLDASAVRALQRIDTFGPLPDAYTGSYINVRYLFEPKQ